MALLSEAIVIGDWLKGEIPIPQHFSRDQIILDNAGGSVATFVTGTVLGKLTATGHFVPLAPTAADGSQTAAGILGATNVIAATSNAATWAITRSATVADINITYPAGITGPQTAAAINQLAALGIIVRRTA